MKSAQPQRIGLLLIPGFSLLSYASVVEPLRAANRLSSRNLYSWQHLSEQSSSVSSSSGLKIGADKKLADAAKLDTLLVCAGGNPALHRNKSTSSRLRRLAREGVQIGGVSGGPYLLARAGLLDGFRCTIHWDHIAAFEEEFPNIAVGRTLYEIDRGRLTCAGGIAGFDMMRSLITTDHGTALATAVSEWFLQTQLRAGSGPQRLTLRERYGVTHPKLLQALKFIEDSPDKALSRPALAKRVNVSVRQLERLFSKHLDITIAELSQKTRLERAHTLLHQTSLPVLEIGVACGFSNASHFSRVYRSRYGRPPQNDRIAAR